MIHEMKLKEIYYNKIKNGEKVYEIRLNDEKRKLIRVGDIIIFKKEPELTDEIKTKVEELIFFKSFKEMASFLPANKIGFDKINTNEIVNIYHEFYSKKDEQKFGVLAIKIKLSV